MRINSISISNRCSYSVISNEALDDITKILKFLEEPSLLTKGVTKAIKIDIKEQKVDFLIH